MRSTTERPAKNDSRVDLEKNQPRGTLRTPNYRNHRGFPIDRVLVRRILGGQIELFEVLMRRHNQRLYRITLSILEDPKETEEALQESFVDAFWTLDQWHGHVSFSTWLSKKAVNEALARNLARKEGVKVQQLPFERPAEQLATTFKGISDAVFDLKPGRCDRIVGRVLDQFTN